MIARIFTALLQTALMLLLSPLVIGFARLYEKKAGVGTLVALMPPYTVATSVAWVLAFLGWYLFGLPFGPG